MEARATGGQHGRTQAVPSGEGTPWVPGADRPAQLVRASGWTHSCRARPHAGPRELTPDGRQGGEPRAEAVYLNKSKLVVS